MRSSSRRLAERMRLARVPIRDAAAFWAVVGASHTFWATASYDFSSEPGRGVSAVVQALFTASFLHTRSVAISAMSR